MSFFDRLFGRRLATHEEAAQKVGALISAFPLLHPYTLPLCLSILVLIALVNLRGVRESGLAFLLPTYLFVGCLLIVLTLGAVKTLLSSGRPLPVDAPSALPDGSTGITLWLLLLRAQERVVVIGVPWYLKA
jgi:amino acid transporter